MYLDLNAGGSPAAIVETLAREASAQLGVQYRGDSGDEVLTAIRGYVEGELKDVDPSGFASVYVALTITTWKPCTPEQAAKAGF